MQTTLAVDDAAETVDALRRRFPLIESSATDDICYATTNRQLAVREIADESDVIIVLGSANSSNSLRLVEVAQRCGVPAHLVDDASEILPEWLAGAATSRYHGGGVRPAASGGRGHRHAACPRPRRGRRARRRARGRHVHPSQGSCRLMAIPLRQGARIGWYLFSQKVRRREKFPLIVELEPLFACNLKCNGCGKIQQPHDLLRQRMPVERAVNAVMESGAPMVSIAGGEPLMHPQIDEMVAEFVKRKKYVYLCTNAELVRKRWDKFNFTPSPYFSFAIHIDGLRERHDESVAKEGVFDEAVAAIKFLKDKGFRVTTNSTFFNTDTPQTIIDVLNFLNDEVQVDSMMISPAYAYEKAPDQDHFLGVTETRELFSKAFAGGNRKRWRLNHSPLFLDFLEGKTDFECTAWGIPSYSLLGWQRPCYLMADGYASTYKELVETTDWSKYGRGKDERCNNCMAHCGYEPTAVLATTGSLKESLRALREQG